MAKRLQVLRWECSRDPSRSPASPLGSSVFGYDDVLVRMHAFISRWRQCPHARPYIVSVDVAKAFECVNTTKVLDLVKGLLRAPSYTIVQYSEVKLGSKRTCCCCKPHRLIIAHSIGLLTWTVTRILCILVQDGHSFIETAY